MSQALMKVPARTNDVLPLLVRDEQNIIHRMEAARDRLYDYFTQICTEEGVEAVVLKSDPFSDKVWVLFKCWLRQPDHPHLTDRSFARLTLVPRPFHRYDHLIDLELRDGQRTRHYKGIVDMEPANVREVVRYLLRRTDFRVFGFKRCRVHPLQFWLPANRVAGLKPDWVGVAPAALAGIGFLTLASVGAAFLLAAGGLFLYHRTRPAYFLSPGRPMQEPRRLLRLDSWQTLVESLGYAYEQVQRAIQEQLELADQEGLQVVRERIWYWGVDGKQEREQMVVTFRRAISFIHIYPYGKDLYVGWAAHVNSGTWVETELQKGLEAATGKFCYVRSIQSGWHVPTEYDITDTNSLIEWVHAAVVRVVKKMLAEHQIDQEVDFKILRGERQQIVGQEAPKAEKHRPLAALFRRDG